LGKVDLAFDHTQNKNDITELSVVIYADSFFYGLWDLSQTLVKVGYHPFTSLEGVLSLWDYNYSFKKVSILSAVKPFVHLDNSDVDELYFETYFKGLYNLSRIRSRLKKLDEFKSETISTLHYLNEKVTTHFDDHVVDYKAAHISTALANYSHEHSSKMICFISNNRLHITLRNQDGFQFYNQFDCFYDYDYLYYVLLIMKEFDLNPKINPIQIGGDLKRDSSLFELLTEHVARFIFIEKSIKISTKVTADKSNFYDLYLCKTCV